jgi:hypothetical protein
MKKKEKKKKEKKKKEKKKKRRRASLHVYNATLRAHSGCPETKSAR